LSVLIAAATAASVAFLAQRNPLKLFMDATASLPRGRERQPAADQSTSATVSLVPSPSIQSSNDVGGLQSAAKDALTRDENTASEIVTSDETERSEPSSEALLGQFQTWAAEKDAQDKATSTQAVQHAPPPVAGGAQEPSAKNARADVRPVQKRRQTLTVRTAGVHRQDLQKEVRRARAERPPAQDARSQ